MENEKELTILIPALNEEETIEIVIKKARKWLKINYVNGEILVVNNGSSDRTKDICEKNNIKVINEPKRGYGKALITGIKNVSSKYIIMGDADDSYNFLEIKEFLLKLREGYDFVIGNRFNYIEKGAMKWTHRYIGTPLLNFLVNKLYHLNIKDINCGLRGAKREEILRLNLETVGMELASEMIIKAKQNNLKICQIPINFYKDKRNRKSNLNAIKDGYRHLKVILENTIKI